MLVRVMRHDHVDPLADIRGVFFRQIGKFVFRHSVSSFPGGGKFRRPVVVRLQLFADDIVHNEAAVAELHPEHTALSAEFVFAERIEAE